MSAEELLKEYILKEYKSIRNFCMRNEFPYSTVDNIFSRGIMGSSVSIIIKICDCLGIDVDELIKGNIVKKPALFNQELTKHELAVIIAYRNNPNMQGAVDKLLGVEEGEDIAEDIKSTIYNTCLPKSTVSK